MMKHLEVLKPEELAAVQKFQEYNAVIYISMGQKVNWAELVHNSKLVSADSLVNYIRNMRERLNKASALSDEDGFTKEDLIKATKVDVYYDRSGTAIIFTVEDCLNFAKAAKSVINYFNNLKEIEDIDKQIARIEEKEMTPAERLAKQKADLLTKKNNLTGIPVQTQTTEVTAEKASL